MKNLSSSLLLVVLTTLGFASQALAASSSDVLLADAVKGNGHITFLKSIAIPATHADGTKDAMRTASYFNSNEHLDGVYTPEIPDPEKLSCLVDYSTSVLDSSGVSPQLITGLDLNIPAGQSQAWEISPFGEANYTYAKNDNGFYEETINLNFDTEHSIMSLYCSVASQDPNHRVTVSDFEAATGGRMTLQADPNPAQAQ